MVRRRAILLALLSSVLGVLKPCFQHNSVRFGEFSTQALSPRSGFSGEFGYSIFTRIFTLSRSLLVPSSTSSSDSAFSHDWEETRHHSPVPFVRPLRTEQTSAGIQIVTWSAADFDAASAHYLIERMRSIIREKGHVVIMLPFGGTPTRIYDIWRTAYTDFPWKKVVLLNGDEYRSANPADPKTAHYYFEENIRPLYRHGLDPKHCFWIDGTAADADAHIRERYQFIAQNGGIDLMVMGIATGPKWSVYRWVRWMRDWPLLDRLLMVLASQWASVHVWFCETGTPFDRGTHVQAIDAHTQHVNGVTYGASITTGPLDVRQAREVVMLSKGPAKRSATELAIFGKMGPRASATIIQHPDLKGKVTFLVDQGSDPRADTLVLAPEQRITAEQLKALQIMIETMAADGIPTRFARFSDGDPRHVAFAYYFLTHPKVATHREAPILWSPEKRGLAFQRFVVQHPQLVAWAVRQETVSLRLNDLFLGIVDLREFEQRVHAPLCSDMKDRAFFQGSFFDLTERQHTYQGLLLNRAAAHPEEIPEVFRSFHHGDLELPGTILDSLLGLTTREGAGVAGFQGNEATLSISSPYTLLRSVFRVLRLSAQDVLLDAGAGHGRPSLYAALVTRVGRSVGIELRAERLDTASRAIHRLDLSHVSLVAGNIRTAGLYDATVIFMFNPFSEDTLSIFLAQAHALAIELGQAGKSLQIISVGGLSTLRLEQQRWLTQSIAVRDGVAAFFVFKSNPTLLSRHIISREA
jgi:6-phosphogluconolactonase/glucosamine-6-phosphate isomerase/deaminase